MRAAHSAASWLRRAHARLYATQPRAIRFWDHISVQDGPAARRVCIDGKPLKTPLGKTLEVPHAKPAALAELIAQEWRVLPSLKLKAHMIPLTSLAGRALDVTTAQREEEAEKLLKYLDTDTLLVLSPHKDCEGKLRAAQEELFPPVVDEARKVWGLPKTGLSTLDTERAACGNYQPVDTRRAVRDWILGLDPWQFASLERATTAAKSLILGMNTVLHLRPVAEIARLASLDVLMQTELWGEVEDTHDVQKEDLARLLGSAYINALHA